MPRPKSTVAGPIFAAVLLACGPSSGLAEDPAPAFWAWAERPPMGWNSYDAFGDSVTENEVLENAQALKDHLLAHGYRYVVVDYRWYDPDAPSKGPGDRIGAKLTSDAFGRLLPSPNRFPSATGSLGFKPLADKIHALGLRFGIHVMRGIPRQSVAARTPIEGSTATAADAADTSSTCPWNSDMYGVDATRPAGRAWYDSIIRQYASWEVDFLKIDDLSRPYSAAEIEAIRSAIDRSGRKLVLSLSPGPTPRTRADHVEREANLWRVSDDVWDHWSLVDHQFDLLGLWIGRSGPGHWPDADMIPFGRIAIRSHAGGSDHRSLLTHDEQTAFMTLWCLESSPLFLGMNLPDNDSWTDGIIGNDDVLAVDQDSAGQSAVPAIRSRGNEVWVKALASGAKAIGFFNRGSKPTDIALTWDDAGLQGPQAVRDLWGKADLGTKNRRISVPVPVHGAVLLTFTPQR